MGELTVVFIRSCPFSGRFDVVWGHQQSPGQKLSRVVLEIFARCDASRIFFTVLVSALVSACATTSHREQSFGMGSRHFEAQLSLSSVSHASIVFPADAKGGQSKQPAFIRNRLPATL
jgi:hypothetical protein